MTRLDRLTERLNLKEFQLDVRGPDARTLTALAERLAREVEQVPGAVDVGLSTRGSKPELNVRIDRVTHVMTLGEPVQVVGGTLRLASVLPQRKRNLTIPARAYRFGFSFDGRSRLELISD